MPWQIQCRKVDGQEWEPISVERCRKIADAYERQYHYVVLDDAKRAFAEYVDIEGGLPNLLIRQATGRPKFTDQYDVRFVWIGEPWIVWSRESQSAGGPKQLYDQYQVQVSSEQPVSETQLDSNKPGSESAATVRWQGQQAGGPPTPDLAAQLDSTTEEPLKTFRRIGVYDYNSLVNCLKANWENVFDEPARDPQNMIQALVAEIKHLRNLNEYEP
jgi:hypothetical protein